MAREPGESHDLLHALPHAVVLIFLIDDLLWRQQIGTFYCSFNATGPAAAAGREIRSVLA